MKDLQKLGEECMQELDSIGIQYRTVACWKVNTRAKRRWGLCRNMGDNTFEIQVSAMLLEDGMGDHAAKATIIHELLHTVDGTHGHKGKWKRLAEKVNKQLPQYNIKRTTTFVDKLGREEKDVVPESTRYEITCTRCGQRFYRTKKSALVKNPKRYRCAHCGGQLKRTK